MKLNSISLKLILVFAVIASVGCSAVSPGDGKLTKSLDVRRAMGWKSDQPEPQVPTRLVSTWTDTVLHRPGEKSQRGFGGRVIFFGRESEDPVCVEGQLVVYAYDEANSDPRTAQPSRRYIFPPEQFARHYSESSLGPSYSVWLPWDEVGGPRKNISLIARFEPTEGPRIIGEQTRHLLPGATLAEDVAAGQPRQSEIQLTQHTESAVSKPNTASAKPLHPVGIRPAMKTTRIRSPDHWRERFSPGTTIRE